MAVINKLRTIGVVVFIEAKTKSEDWAQIPNIVKNHLNSSKDSIPYVVLTTPDLDEKFGGYTHKHLKSGDYTAIFKEAKKEISEAKKLGRLDYTQNPDDANAAEEHPTVEISNPSIQKWVSSSDTTIEAKLLKVENGDRCIFQTSQGRTIEVSLDQLSRASARRARKLIKANR